MECARLGIKRTSCQPSSTAIQSAGEQPPWNSDFILKSGNWLEGSISTSNDSFIPSLHVFVIPSLISAVPCRSPGCGGTFLQFSSAFHGFQHRYFVCIFKVSADRNANPNSRHSHSQRLQQFGKVNRCGFAFRGGICGDDNFFDGPTLQSFDERLDVKLLRPASRKRR